jgi:hypothetical protein
VRGQRGPPNGPAHDFGRGGTDMGPALALDPDGLLRACAALIVACGVAALPRRWRVAGTAALVVALVFFVLR